MIDSIGSSMASRPPPPPPSSSNNSLSSEQTSLIEDALSNYDASNLSSEDATSLVETFSEAGINPSSAFADILAASGFDAQEIGTLANVGDGGSAGHRPPPPSGGEQSSSGLDLASVIDYLDSLPDSESLGSANTSSMAAQLAEKFGLSEGQSLINVSA
jgi:hypothetical protein